MIKTLYLNGFSHRLCGRRRRPESERVREQAKRLEGLAGLVAKFIPPQLFKLSEAQRERIFSPWVTFIALSLIHI